MRALIAIVGMVIALFTAKSVPASVIPPKPDYAPTNHIAYEDDELDWFVYNLEAQRDYVAEFNAIYNALETKWSKNNRLMIRSGNSGSFKFVKKA